ncbi:peroxisome biogenesis factor 2-like [Argiope bruennichi]|uniref:RING-type E3 ubiquitin transferase (cysteine targeting) n=1 Tax=Argiope bruennichi TaxID=94029 RepID=A0A8T0FM89_ARGBR|nr:peroxisome biogenesis factor 2-like [Argiope bruennichi]KAF8792161.1 Peroxisome biogenesis factor 2 like protein [Argiope bruennichi]
MASNFVRRVDQLDANVLDEELLHLLNTQYRKAFIYLPNSILARLGPELDVLFKFLFKYLPLSVLKCTFGQNLFQLQYHRSGSHQLASNNRLCTLAFISVCVPWLWDRIVRKIILTWPNNELSNKTLDASYVLERKFSAAHQLFALINFCIFLQKSTYLTLYERLLKVRPLYSVQQNIRSVQNDNIDRELLWHGLSEFLGFALPLINVTKIKGFFKRTFMPKSYKSHYKKYFIHNNLCSICGDIPNFPHTFGCSHVFCYYCISSIVLADPAYLCLDCDIKANGIENLKPLDSAKM